MTAALQLRQITDRLERDARYELRGPEWERRAQRMVQRVQRCKRHSARLERSDGQTRQMMMMPLPCGSRMCPECGMELRKRAQQRMEAGPAGEAGEQDAWRTVITLTMRYGDVDGALAWERIGSWVSRWMAASRRWERRNRPWMLDCSRQYAWVLEQTKRGWPHVHIILARPYTTHDREAAYHSWACDAWEKITGCYVSRKFVRKRDGRLHGIGVDIQPVVSEVAAAKYLSLYLSKSILEPWHYAVLGRKRVWSTTVAPVKEETKGWRLRRVIEEIEDPSVSDKAHERLESAGWRPVWMMESGLSMWERLEWGAGPECAWMEEALRDWAQADGVDPPYTGRVNSLASFKGECRAVPGG